MTSILKKSLLMALACVCVGTYGVVEAQGTTDAQTRVSEPLEMSVEQLFLALLCQVLYMCLPL